jgi:hypothetical protein
MQEFKILKMFVCFDLPLSSLNRIQAEQISDLDNYLVAKSCMHLVNSEFSKKTLTGGQTGEKCSEFTTSNGTPDNLLRVY